MTESRPCSSRLAAAADRIAIQPSTESWRSYLANELNCPVRVVYTRARKKPLQVRPVPTPHARGVRRASALEVRMHTIFAAAPPEIQRAVASWIRSGRRAPRACALLDRWILECLEKLPAVPARESSLRAHGDCYDLVALAADLCASELAGAFSSSADLPRLTWGRQGQSRTRHSIRLGSYDQEGSVVRIHTALDQADVPRFFVRFVLFHELLHALHPPRKGEGARWIHHGREFREREQAYPDYARAIAWEKEHIQAVIRSARRGTPLRRAPAPTPPTARRERAAGHAHDIARPAAARTPEASPGRQPAPAGGGAHFKVQRVFQGMLFALD